MYYIEKAVLGRYSIFILQYTSYSNSVTIVFSKKNNVLQEFYKPTLYKSLLDSYTVRTGNKVEMSIEVDRESKASFVWHGPAMENSSFDLPRNTIRYTVMLVFVK